MTYPQYSTESLSAAEEAATADKLRFLSGYIADYIDLFALPSSPANASAEDVARLPAVAECKPSKPRSISAMIKQAKRTSDVVIPRSEPVRSTPMNDVDLERPPKWDKYELERVMSLRRVEDMTSLDRDTLVRVYKDYLVKLSPKRWGMKFRNVLKIINGDAAA
jgi:hypothetical protein